MLTMMISKFDSFVSIFSILVVVLFPRVRVITTIYLIFMCWMIIIYEATAAEVCSGS